MRFTAFSLLLLSVLSPTVPAQVRSAASTRQTAQKPLSPRQLDPEYRRWIEEDVPYIISERERKEFLLLRNNDERDKFIEAFWESRNPTPNSTINTFKEEHYRRLAYAREHFGDERYNDGWRTDMGRVYITLGPPKQTAKYHGNANVRPMEIWFYESLTPALPPYFNLVFYKRSESDPYTLYSPTEDGPGRLITNDARGTSLAAQVTTILQSIGSEAAQASLSLYPGEPVNLRDPATPTMQSDILLSMVRSLPEQRLEKERIEALRHANQEHVTASIFTGANVALLDTALLRDNSGRQTLHFLMRNQQLDPALIGVLPSKQTGYTLSLQTRVMTADGKAVYQQQDTLQGGVSESGAKAARAKLFGAEGRLPVVPGNYEVETTLTNNLTHEATRVSRKITVPPVNPGTVGISDLVAFSAAPTRDPEGQLPFSASNVRFTPRGSQMVQLHVGEKLPIMFQIWFPAADLKQNETATPKQVHLHYLVGTVAGGQGAAHEEDEDVEVTNLDAAGNLLTGHTVDTSHLEQGTYRLIAKVTEPGTPRSAFATMTVKVLPSEVTTSMWTAYGPESQHPAWQEDVERGVAARTLGHNAEAAMCFRRALAARPGDEGIQAMLDAVTKAQGAGQSATK